MSPATTRQAEPDQACAQAVDLARAAAQDDAGPGQVGEHVGIEVDGDRIVTHLFACLSPAYVGWRWAVTVTRAARSKVATVSECVLLPGPDSLLAPDWVPWTERVRPGDLRVGDLMPASSDDERLVPVVAIAGEAGLLDWDESESWTLGGALALIQSSEPGQAAAEQAEAEQAKAEQTEAEQAEAERAEAGEPAEARGLAAGEAPQDAAPGRVTRSRAARRPERSRNRAEGALRPTRILSATGRDEAAVRWYTGDHGPNSPLATAAPANCLSCGFLIRLSGPLGRVFGVCANEYAPDDGTVVSVDHGCGAHSDGEAVADAGGAIPTIDELGYDMLNPGASLPESVIETLDHELL